MADVYFITHPEVRIDPAVPVPEWGLSPLGLQRMRTLERQPWLQGIRAVWCSTERKAREGGEIIAGFVGAPLRQLAELGENDRSATGYLPKAEFETVANAFFASPHESVRGWERAIDAQRRIFAAIEAVVAESPAAHDIAVVSHGGVGALLLCRLKGCAITRTEDQPGDGGGNYYCFDKASHGLIHGWLPIDGPASGRQSSPTSPSAGA